MPKPRTSREGPSFPRERPLSLTRGKQSRDWHSSTLKPHAIFLNKDPFVFHAQFERLSSSSRSEMLFLSVQFSLLLCPCKLGRSRNEVACRKFRRFLAAFQPHERRGPWRKLRRHSCLRMHSKRRRGAARRSLLRFRTLFSQRAVPFRCWLAG